MDDHITVCPLPAENAWQLSFVTFSKNQGVMTTWPTWLLTTTCTSNDARLSGNRGHFTRETQGNMRGKSEYPRLVKHFVNCQLEVDKGKLTAGVKFYKADVSSVSPWSEQRRGKSNARNLSFSLWRSIHLYQLQVTSQSTKRFTCRRSNTTASLETNHLTHLKKRFIIPEYLRRYSEMLSYFACFIDPVWQNDVIAGSLLQ